MPLLHVFCFINQVHIVRIAYKLNLITFARILCLDRAPNAFSLIMVTLYFSYNFDTFFNLNTKNFEYVGKMR